jgi:glycosyltransferase involved in cell wall biosynthesis
MSRKILYLTSSNALQGGAELCLMKIVEHFQACGDRPAVAMPEEGPIAAHYRQRGVPVHMVPYHRLSSKGGWSYRLAFAPKFLRSIHQMKNLIRRESFDLVHVNELIDFNGIVAARHAGVPSVCHVRLILERPRWMRSILVGAARRYADRVLCVSEGVRRKMIEGEGFRPGQAQVLYDGGPDLTRFDPARVRSGVRAELGIPEDVFVVGLVSKVARVKGHDQLIRAAARLPELGVNDFRIVLVGGGLPGHEDYFEELQAAIRDSGIADRILQTGARSDVADLLSAFDVYVHLPLYQEPFPGVVLEALAMERAVVAYDSGGIGEQFEPGQSGLLIPQGDVEAVAKALANLFREPNRRIAMGKQGREFLLSHFSLERHFSELAQVYDEVLDTSGKGIK